MATVIYAVDVWRSCESDEHALDSLMAFRSKRAAMCFARAEFRRWKEDGWHVTVDVTRYTLVNLSGKDLYCRLLSRTLFASNVEAVATMRTKN